MAALWCAVDYDGNVYVIREHFEAGKDITYHSNKIKQICSSLNWHKNRFGEIDAIIDSAANQKTLASAKSVTELFREEGIYVNPQVNKDMWSGIQRVKKYLKSADGKTKLYIFKNCVNLIREFKCYWWGEGDNPKKKDDHALDALRYFIMTKPENVMPKKPKTAIQKDKERLFKEILNERKR